MTLNEIQDFLEIRPDLLTAGQPFSHQFASIREAGCEVVINLAMPASPDYIPDEQSLVESLGMTYIAIPVVWEAPQPADLAAFFAALEQQAGKKLFVHCARNMRVSAFVFLHRVLVRKEDPEVCRETMMEIWEPEGVWADFIDERLKDRGG